MIIENSKLKAAARLGLGAIFLFFGLNGFLQFLPQPPLEGAAAALLGGFAASGYMFPLIKGTEVIAGLFLLSARYVPLSLTILAPVVVNILAFHAFLAPIGLLLPLVVLVLGVYLAYTERAVFAPLLRARSDASATQSQLESRGNAATAV